MKLLLDYELRIKKHELFDNVIIYYLRNILCFRGAISNFDASPNHGNVVLSPDKYTLVWNIGQKFPAKTLEVLLKATVNFAFYDDSQPQTAEEQFCVKQNTFAQVGVQIFGFHPFPVILLVVESLLIKNP